MPDQESRVSFKTANIGRNKIRLQLQINVTLDRRTLRKWRKIGLTFLISVLIIIGFPEGEDIGKLIELI